jgi:hypothetical protein
MERFEMDFDEDEAPIYRVLGRTIIGGTWPAFFKCLRCQERLSGTITDVEIDRDGKLIGGEWEAGH